MLYSCITYPAPPFNKCCTPFWPDPPAPSRLGPIHPPPALRTILGFADVRSRGRYRARLRGTWAAAIDRISERNAPPWSVFLKSLIEHEVETRGEPSLVLGSAHQQLAAKETVGAVLWLAPEKKPGGQHAGAAPPHPHMKMALPAGTRTGHHA